MSHPLQPAANTTAATTREPLDVVLKNDTMPTKLVTGFAAGTIGMIAAACSLSTAPPPDQDITEFCDDWAKAICQLSNGPCYFDESVCAAYQNTVCMNFVNAAQSSTRQYNQSGGKKCIDALNAAYGGSPSAISASTLADLNATCEKAIVGNQALNQACSSDNDCAGSLVCAPVVGTSASQCVSGVTQKTAGAVCADPGDQCPADFYCAPQSNGSPTCIPTPTTGACSAAVPCDSSETCIKGTCQARLLVGATCTSSDECPTSAPYCDLYPPAQCTNGLSFARGSDDCNGTAGLDQPVVGTPVTSADAAAGD